jgi:hypothetical protein
MQDLLWLCVFISDPVQCLTNTISGLIIHKNLIIWLILIEKLLLNRLPLIPTIGFIYLWIPSMLFFIYVLDQFMMSYLYLYYLQVITTCCPSWSLIFRRLR